MSEASKSINCQRCGSPMTLDTQPYALPYLLLGNDTDHTTVSVKKSRMLQLFLCSNPDCRTTELKVPDGWPVVTRGQR